MPGPITRRIHSSKLLGLPCQVGEVKVEKLQLPGQSSHVMLLPGACQAESQCQLHRSTACSPATGSAKMHPTSLGPISLAHLSNGIGHFGLHHACQALDLLWRYIFWLLLLWPVRHGGVAVSRACGPCSCTRGSINYPI